MSQILRGIKYDYLSDQRKNMNYAQQADLSESGMKDTTLEDVLDSKIFEETCFEYPVPILYFGKESEFSV